MKIIEVKSNHRSLVRMFNHLPEEIYKNVPQWVPPLSFDQSRWFDHRQPFYRRGEAAFFLVIDAGDVVGRLAILNNKGYNAYQNQNQAFFYLLECVDQIEAAQCLFNAASDWAWKRGLDTITGPRGFTPFDGLGLLVDGFEHRPAFGLPYNPPYYSQLLEGCGFCPTGDIVSGYLSSKMPFPEKIHTASRRIQDRWGIRVARCNTRKDLRAVIPYLKELYNQAMITGEGTMPLDEAEVNALARQLLWFANPRLVKIILKGERPIGFLLAYPDVSAAVQRARGKILPFGWFHLLKESKKSVWVNINGAGIIPEYRGFGGTAILFSEICKSILEEKYEYAELVQIGVDNTPMQLELRKLGVDFYKTHRMYEKRLDNNMRINA